MTCFCLSHMKLFNIHECKISWHFVSQRRKFKTRKHKKNVEIMQLQPRRNNVWYRTGINDGD